MVLRIKELRKQRGMERKQFASEMGIALPTVVDWECETYLPRTRELPLLARVLGCSISELFVEELERFGLVDDEAQKRSPCAAEANAEAHEDNMMIPQFAALCKG